jgi:cation:H+ antiporter
MDNLSLFSLIIIFLAAAAITWWAGIALTKTTDTLDTRFKLGDALGGLILLGISGSLPELAITVSAAYKGHIPIIIGTLLGGLALQTLILIIFDFFIKGRRPLSYLAGSINMSIETAFAIILTILALLATFIPRQYAFFNMNPLSIVIVIAWVGGLYLINKFRKIARFNEVSVPDAAPGRKHHERRAVENHPFYANKKNGHVILIFLAACIATLIAGVVLEESGSALAAQLGIGSGLFAATVLALVSALPEISTGLESIFIGDNQLAISDIMGGNAFMLTIFLLADIIAQKPVLSYTGKSDLLFAILAIGMMAVYAVSFIKKLKNRYFRLGLDSITELILYALGIVVLSHIV